MPDIDEEYIHSGVNEESISIRLCLCLKSLLVMSFNRFCLNVALYIVIWNSLQIVLQSWPDGIYRYINRGNSKNWNQKGGSILVILMLIMGNKILI